MKKPERKFLGDFFSDIVKRLQKVKISYRIKGRGK